MTLSALVALLDILLANPAKFDYIPIGRSP
jgi:hypothetical protein